jgi:hypothetical protein
MSTNYKLAIGAMGVFLAFGFLLGYAVTSTLTSETIIEKVIEQVVEVPVITEKLVEVDKKIIVQMPQQIHAEHGPNLLLPENGAVPISRWVDPKNLNIIYAVPDGYNAVVIPMYASVPDQWFQVLLNDYALNHPEGLSQEFIEWMPRDWLKVILPGELKYRLTENTDTLLPPNINSLVP